MLTEPQLTSVSKLSYIVGLGLAPLEEIQMNLAVSLVTLGIHLLIEFQTNETDCSDEAADRT